MDYCEKLAIASTIVAKAKEFGASLVGFANVEELKEAPSFTVAPQMPEYNGVGTGEEKLYLEKHGKVSWPKEAKTVIVVAYSHPQDQPDLDYWYGQSNPIGNKKLITIVKKLVDLVPSLNPGPLPYHVEKGGIFLKDAAVLAGLGCIGKNNLLLTPEYGARVRLRALTINMELRSTGPLQFDPCVSCLKYCHKACPQQAFAKQIYTAAKLGRAELPGREGNYSRIACNEQMKLDEKTGMLQEVAGVDKPVQVIKYCRRCEFSCPAGAVT